MHYWVKVFSRYLQQQFPALSDVTCATQLALALLQSYCDLHDELENVGDTCDILSRTGRFVYIAELIADDVYVACDLTSAVSRGNATGVADDSNTFVVSDLKSVSQSWGGAAFDSGTKIAENASVSIPRGTLTASGGNATTTNNAVITGDLTNAIDDGVGRRQATILVCELKQQSPTGSCYVSDSSGELPFVGTSHCMEPDMLNRPVLLLKWSYVNRCKNGMSYTLKKELARYLEVGQTLCILPDVPSSCPDMR